LRNTEDDTASEQHSRNWFASTYTISAHLRPLETTTFFVILIIYVYWNIRATYLCSFNRNILFSYWGIWFQIL